MKVAFATQDLTHVDAHFGCAPSLAVYEVEAEGHRLDRTHLFGAAEQDGDEDKLEPRLDAIGDCAILVVAAIGSSAAARALARGVYPLKSNGSEPITAVLDRLRGVLAGPPPPWLRRALTKRNERKLDLGSEVA